MAEPLAVRFWRKVRKTKNCWLWTATTNGAGYGMIRPGGLEEKKLAHRVSYELHGKTIPEGLDLMHKCDNPLCVNPKHLIPGTHKQNLNDSLTRGRHPAAVTHPGHGRWKKNVVDGRALLLADKQEEIRTKRAKGRSINSLAHEYDVDWTVAARITRGICTHRQEKYS